MVLEMTAPTRSVGGKVASPALPKLMGTATGCSWGLLSSTVGMYVRRPMLTWPILIGGGWLMPMPLLLPPLVFHVSSPTGMADVMVESEENE